MITRIKFKVHCFYYILKNTILFPKKKNTKSITYKVISNILSEAAYRNKILKIDHFQEIILNCVFDLSPMKELNHKETKVR